MEPAALLDTPINGGHTYNFKAVVGIGGQKVTVITSNALKVMRLK